MEVRQNPGDQSDTLTIEVVDIEDYEPAIRESILRGLNDGGCVDLGSFSQYTSGFYIESKTGDTPRYRDTLTANSSKIFSSSTFGAKKLGRLTTGAGLPYIVLPLRSI